jgi:hypothetical protein
MFGGQIATAEWLRELATATHLTHLEELSLYGGTRSGRDSLDPAALELFCGAGHLVGLRKLDLGDLYHTDWRSEWPELMTTLSSARFAPALRSLSLCGCMIEDTAAGILAGTAAFRGLTDLNLAGCDFIRAPGMEALIRSPHLSGLVKVGLPFGAHLGELAANPRLQKWAEITLSGYASGGAAIGRGGEEPIPVGRVVERLEWATFLRSPHLAPRVLHLGANVELPPDAGEALLAAHWVKDLEGLALSFFSADGVLERLFTAGGGPRRIRSLALPPLPEVISALAEWPGLAGITDLSMTEFRSDDVEPVLRSAHLGPRLASLEISGGCRTLSAVSALAGHSGLRGLRHLGFGYNALDGERAELLAGSAFALTLEALHLGSESDGRGQPDASGTVADAFEVLVAPENFPRLRDVVVGSDTEEGEIPRLRERFGPRLRVWSDC